MLIYVLRWWPSWISDRHEKQKLVKDIPMIIHLEFGFSHFISFSEEKLFIYSSYQYSANFGNKKPTYN